MSKRNSDAPRVKRIPARLWSEDLSSRVKIFVSISVSTELMLGVDYLRRLLRLVAVSDNSVGEIPVQEHERVWGIC